MKSNVNTILMMGKTGSGKGTQSELLSKKLGFEVFSTGDEFRKLRARKDALGERVRSEYDQGILMPHWYASYLFENAFLNLEPSKGLVCEGIGRKEPEARLFDEVAKWLERDYIVFELVVSDEEVIKRQLLRGRMDSNDEAKIKVRLNEYRTYTEQAINFFKSINKVIGIDGMSTPEKIHEEVLKKLSEHNG
ncbi:MAG: nucleoside monophosphate kinase [Candidatus Taylorbacteria bacterium]|nr:nucleoside monophosphate kinase [Candidatus Taylorbacteria bacterium]